ncbi:MAG: ATP-binding cassette domain-containing protein, partial [Pseudomonadales bacterium]|nr:ATP-binding cassette domain-containing protein [Pseudomonadales bacterium]
MKKLHVGIDIQRDSGFKLKLEMQIKSGEITALYGPSGSGKSTVLNLIAGLEKPKGDVRINAEDEIWVDESTFLDTHKRAVGYVTQRPALLPHLNVMGNLQYAKQRRHKNADIDIEQVSRWLDIQALLNKPVAHLSGGEQQRVSIARALLSSPSVMLMDEPLGS